MRPARPSRLRRDERGVTLVETLVGLALATIVAVPILGLLQGGATNERRQADTVAALTSGDAALERIATDIRAASGISAQPGGTTNGSALSLRTIVDGKERYVIWLLDGEWLLRIVTDSSGNKESVAYVLDGLVESKQNTFVVTGRTGNELDSTEKGGVDLSACATAISVHLEQAVNTTVRVAETTVAIRSSIDQEAKC
jgi:type II secretory pathway pseudopilin PulG